MRRPPLYIRVNNNDNNSHNDFASGSLSTCSYHSPLLTPTPTPAPAPTSASGRAQLTSTFEQTRKSKTTASHKRMQQQQNHSYSPQAVTPPTRRRPSSIHSHNIADVIGSARTHNETPHYLRTQSVILGERRTPASMHSVQSVHAPLYPLSPSSSLLVAGMHSPTHPQIRSVPRSRSRRPSITLQSSISHNIPVSLPQTTYHQLVPTAMRKAATFSAASRTAESAKSLPADDSAGTAVATDAARSFAQRNRRRSIAYERYPPLISIFESGTGGGQQQAPAASALSQHTPTASSQSSVPLPSAVTHAPSIVPLPSPFLMPPILDEDIPEASYNCACGCSQRQPQSAFPDADKLDPQPSGRHGATTHAPHTNRAPYPGTEQSSSDICPLLRRSPSSSSLISVFSIASTSSSSSSSSSEHSTYAYIFDSARPSAFATPSNDAGAAENYWSSFCAGPSGHSVTSILFGPNSLFFSDMAVGPAPISNGSAEPAGERTQLLCSEHNSATSYQQNSSTGRGAAEPGSMYASSSDDYLPTVRLWAREAKCILWTMSPLLAGNILQATISMSQVASSGHLGRDELTAIGLAHMVVILTGYPVAFSVLSCLETCTSQAFTSAQPLLVGGYFLRAVQVQWLFGLILGSVWFSSGPLLAHILRDANHAVISAAVDYLHWYFVPFMVFSNYLCSRQILYAQGVTYPLPYLTLLGTVTTLGAQYLLVFAPYFKLGVRGVALGSGISYLVMLLATLLVIRRHNAQRIWGGFGSGAPWMPFLKLMPSCLILAWFSTATSEIITMAATQLGASSLTVQAVISALSRMFMIASSSSGVASLNRTGNLIGGHNARGAKVSSHVSLCLGLAFAFLCGAALMLWPDFWIGIFTNDAAVGLEARKLLPIAALAFTGQATAFVGSQLLSAQGRQAMAVRIKLVALYGIGLPLGYYWTMEKGFGLWGLWAAVAVGQLCTAFIETVVVLRTNWPRLITKCSETIVRSIV